MAICLGKSAKKYRYEIISGLFEGSYRFISTPQVREVRQGRIGLKYLSDLRQSHNNPRSRIWQVNYLAVSGFRCR